MPYAAKAIIAHDFDVDHLDIYIEFRHPMDTTVKPANDVWLVYIDEILTSITSSTWLDQYTMLLIIESVASEPDKVTVAYDGPDPLLITAWDKQWNPWAPIPSYAGWPTTFKYGMIILWHGSIVSIPAGWHLCDGSVGTPDLRDRFVVGAGTTYDVDDTGGYVDHDHTASQVAHTHGFLPGLGLAMGFVFSSTTGSKQPNITVDSSVSLPPYYALCYIMKL